MFSGNACVFSGPRGVNGDASSSCSEVMYVPAAANAFEKKKVRGFPSYTAGSANGCGVGMTQPVPWLESAENEAIAAPSMTKGN